jgi:CRISPR/Cas system CSM-associated protein Csm3 (group 7 of RAMP superfamily)
MGYAIATRYEVRGTLVCLSPVHVGGWDHTADAHLTVIRDGADRPILPGTSIAGALRAYLGRLERFQADQGPTPVENLFGRITPKTQEGSPSWVRIDDAYLIDESVTPVVRDGVGIDRHAGSAAAGCLYTRQVLPPGTRFALRMVVDTPTAVPETSYPDGWPALVRDALETMIAGLRHAQVPIGAGRGSGLGKVQLTEVTVRRADLSDPAGLVAWLTGTAPAVPLGEAAASPPADGRLRVTVTWQPVSPLLVRDSLSSTLVDTLPLTEPGPDGTVRLLLPGSSLRGALRAYAERIERTVRGEDAPRCEPDRFGEALRNPPPVVGALFGVAPARDRAASRTGGEPAPAPEGRGTKRRGALAVADCHSVHSIPQEEWHYIVTGTPEQTGSACQEAREQRAEQKDERERARALLRAALEKLRGTTPLSISDHVAIDRWTGGASDHRLFSVLDPATTMEWEPIHLEVDTAWLQRHPEPGISSAALALLLILLRDLRDGWLTLGYGGTRGRGQVQLTDVRFDGAGLPEPWNALAGKTLDDILTDPPAQVVDAIAAWRDMTTKEAV